MSILTRIARAIYPGLAQPRRNFGWFINPTVAEIPVTEETALTMAAVWACVCVNAEAMASLPWHTLQEDGDRRIRVRQHPADALMRLSPNSDMSPFDWVASQVVCEELFGNSYSIIERRRFDGTPLSLMPVYPPRVELRREDSGLLVYLVTDDSGNVYRIEQADMFHVKGPSLDGLSGMEAVRFAAKSIGLGLACEKFGINLFSQGCRPSGTLEVPQVLSDEAYERLKADWAAQYCSLQSSAKVVLLEQGTKFTQIANTAEEAQFLESRKLQRREVCSRWRTPPHKIGDLEDAHFTNIEHQEIDWVRTKITPLSIRFEQEFNRKLLSVEDRAAGIYGKFNLRGLLRGDYKSRMEGYNIGRMIGMYSANDLRRLEDEDPISQEDGGDDYWRPANMLVAGAPAPLPAQAANVNNKQQVAGVFGELAREAMHRCLRKESKALERNWERGLDDAFYAQLAIEIGDAMLPVLSGLSTLVDDGRSPMQLADDARTIGRVHVAISRQMKAKFATYAEWHAAMVDTVEDQSEAAVNGKADLSGNGAVKIAA